MIAVPSAFERVPVPGPKKRRDKVAAAACAQNQLGFG